MLYAALKVSYIRMSAIRRLYVLGKYRVGITMVFEDLNLSSVKHVPLHYTFIYIN